FRLWLWLGTGMVTREWVSIHRKHHAKCETADDPHSPQTRGISTVMWAGAELYRQEAKNTETVQRYSHGTPNDWVERNIYSRFQWQGVGLLLVVNVLAFGALGATIWAVQMAWIPFFAAGVINGIGHYWGYRNFEASDASTNVSPWGILIGGEELHNNHHTYPTSAKFSVKPYEFDIGWVYIRLLAAVGLAKVRKTPPQLVKQKGITPPADENTLDALITHRYAVMAQFSKALRLAVREQLRQAQAGGADVAALQAVKRWLHRDEQHVPEAIRPAISQVLHDNAVLQTMAQMREELREFWSHTRHTPAQLAAALQQWCAKAEASGIAPLREFSLTLRAVRT
ncbi:MAG: DesA family fatty acid desaturase, partial [Burkholderiaceae bacterium]